MPALSHQGAYILLEVLRRFEDYVASLPPAHNKTLVVAGISAGALGIMSQFDYIVDMAQRLNMVSTCTPP